MCVQSRSISSSPILYPSPYIQTSFHVSKEIWWRAEREHGFRNGDVNTPTYIYAYALLFSFLRAIYSLHGSDNIYPILRFLFLFFSRWRKFGFMEFASFLYFGGILFLHSHAALGHPVQAACGWYSESRPMLAHSSMSFLGNGGLGDDPTSSLHLPLPL